MKSIITAWAGYISHMKDRRNTGNIIANKSGGKRPFRRH
jgi:hypothetical protein